MASAWTYDGGAVHIFGKARHGRSRAATSGRNFQVRRSMGARHSSEPTNKNERRYARTRVMASHVYQGGRCMECHQVDSASVQTRRTSYDSQVILPWPMWSVG